MDNIGEVGEVGSGNFKLRIFVLFVFFLPAKIFINAATVVLPFRQQW
jgi:hypothetical protein